MLRELFRIGEVPIHGYGVMVLIGVLAGLWLLRRNALEVGLDATALIDSAVWMVLAGLVGGRLFYVVQHWHRFGEDPWLGPFKIWEGGLVVYGAIAGSVGWFVLSQLVRGRPVLPALDAMASAAAVGIGFGRIGCFLNGCCWGKACTPGFPLGVMFPPDSVALEAASAPLHPTQLYESANAFLLALVLWAALRCAFPVGTVTGIAGLLYACSRFTLEELRGDHAPSPGSWPISQAVSVWLLVAACGLLAWSQRNAIRRRAPSLAPV